MIKKTSGWGLTLLSLVVFVFAFVWGIGSTLDSSRDGRAKFDIWWRKTFTEVEFPEGGTVFDYCINTEVTGFVHWNSMVPGHISVDVTDLKTLLVPTIETTILSYFMQHAANANHSTMLVGPTGCGKTVMAKHVLDAVADNFSHSVITKTDVDGK